MMRALFSGVTGLRSHQTRMDVIGNNIANVNTVGFKKSSVTFKDLYSETISAAAANSGTGAGSTGGVNARQIGLGVTVDSISVVHTPGAAQYTGNSMDVAISGDGYFVVQSPSGLKYTRSGNFGTDAVGNLVTSGGYYVMVVDPVVSSVNELVYNSAVTDNMFVANTAISKPASTVHTGSVTADLSTVQGQTYGFKFIPAATGGFISNISVNYRPSLPAASSLAVVPPAGGTTVETLSMKAVADAYLAVVPTGTTGGDKAVTFVNNGGMIEMQVDGVTVSSAAAPAAGWIDGEDRAITFGNSIGTINLRNNSGVTDPTVDDIVAELNSLENLPAIPLEEAGDWYIVDRANGDTPLEKVNITYSATGLTGSQISSGDILFTTTNYGTMRLNLNRTLDGMAQLSDELASSSFSFDITSEPFVSYSTPGIEVAESALKTLKLDFDRFTSVAIDTKGAVVAQLKNDEPYTINGQTIQMKAGDKVVLGYVALANFNNPSGLEKVSNNLYERSSNSGVPVYQMPDSGNVGSLAPSNLEMSNVDLSEEMVNMIITQRGFQANSRIITVTDTMLEELINLKR